MQDNTLKITAENYSQYSIYSILEDVKQLSFYNYRIYLIIFAYNSNDDGVPCGHCQDSRNNIF